MLSLLLCEASPANAQARAGQPVTEALVERAEEAEERAEVLPSALTLAQGASQCSAERSEALARHIARLKAKIAHIRVSKRIDRALPHATTRWLVHMPKKRAHIKQLRQRIRDLRNMQGAC